MSKTISNFIDSLDATDLKLLEMHLSLAREARDFVQEFRLTPEQFCEGMSLKRNKYEKYLKGSYPYSMMDVARFKAFYCRLCMEKIKEEADKKGIQIAKPNAE